METTTLPFPSKEFSDIWEEWIQYRKERKFAKYAPTGLKRTFNKLLDDCNSIEATAIKMIEQAMAMSWQGIHPLKNNYGQNQSVATNWGVATKVNGNTVSTPL